MLSCQPAIDCPASVVHFSPSGLDVAVTGSPVTGVTAHQKACPSGVQAHSHSSPGAASPGQGSCLILRPGAGEEGASPNPLGV